jgi:hypothetical protein
MEMTPKKQKKFKSWIGKDISKQTRTEDKALLNTLDKQFPKGDKARGKALVLFALAQIEIDKRNETIIELIYKINELKGQYKIGLTCKGWTKNEKIIVNKFIKNLENIERFLK